MLEIDSRLERELINRTWIIRLINVNIVDKALGLCT